MSARFIEAAKRARAAAEEHAGLVAATYLNGANCCEMAAQDPSAADFWMEAAAAARRSVARLEIEHAAAVTDAERAETPEELGAAVRRMTDKVPVEILERISSFDEAREARCRQVAEQMEANEEARRAAVHAERQAYCAQVAALNQAWQERNQVSYRGMAPVGFEAVLF